MMGRFTSKVNKLSPNGCWLWKAYVRASGYGEFRYGQRMVAAHRVSWELHNGPIPEGLCVLHKCDVRNCVNPEHLFLGTKKDNTQDMIKKGRRHDMNQKGPFNGNAKLSTAQVMQIQKDKRPLSTISACYGITIVYACRIRNGRVRRSEVSA